MKKLFGLIMIILIVAGSAHARINLPKAKEIKLDNGLTVRVIERLNLPLFSVRISFKAGSIYDPIGREGLANLSNEMLMRGTATRTSKQIAEEIAYGGGTLYNSCSRQTADFSGEFLRDNGEAGMAVLADLLVNSVFLQEEIEKTKTRIKAGLESQLEDPSATATEQFYKILLGDNKFAHQTTGTIETVDKLARTDILDFVKNHYTPDNCLLVFCGDIDVATAESWAKKYFQRWLGKAKIDRIESKFSTVSGKEILILDKEDATQTQIRIGNISLPLNHPDFIPFTLARSIFAGSFTSRLMNEIRVTRGLTYGVSMRTSFYKPGGVAYVSTFTKNQSVGEVLGVILAEAKRMQTEPVPDSELAGSINYRCGLYPLQFETSEDIIETFVNIWYYGLDKSHYEDFQEKLRDVTAKDVIEMAGKYFPQNNYRIVLVGKADEIEEQAKQYGKVVIRAITDQGSL